MGNNNHTKYTKRYIARITLEAETPVAVGSGKGNLLTDSVVVTDINGLPFIPGTSLAGVVRSACNIARNAHSPFGYQEKNGGEGSRIIFSDAVMVGKDGKPVDGLQVIDYNDEFYSHFKTLPIRQHVRIGKKGTTEEGGKFDEQIVYKGVRFCFEMEMLSAGGDEDNADKSFFEKMLNEVNSKTFRVGSGTRHGFGLMQVAEPVKFKVYDLLNADDFKDYISRSASLDSTFKGAEKFNAIGDLNKDWHRYSLILKPKDFFLFGSGMGDADVDMAPVHESYVDWDNSGKPFFCDDGILIPASSVKGALAHRTAYYWNKLNNFFVDNEDESQRGFTGDNNKAVKAIFGSNGQENEGDITRGNILLSDIIIPKIEDKVINHVAIDRFTGGGIDGALFNEKVINGRSSSDTISIDIYVKVDSLKDDSVREAFEKSLQDIANGLLPLGGGVNRGNGSFTGKFDK